MVSNSDYDASGETPEIATLDPEPVHSLPPSFSVGSTLREGRERMGKDIAQVASTLRIRHPYLAALEDGRFKDLPGGTYAIGFLRTYAEFLGLDGEEMVRRFRQEAADSLSVHAELQFPSPVSEGRMPSAPVLMIGLSIAVVAYGLWLGVVYTRDNMADLIPAVPEHLASLLRHPAGLGTVEAPPPPPAEPAVVEDKAQAADTPSAPTAQADQASAPVEEIKPSVDVVPPSDDDAGKVAGSGTGTAPSPSSQGSSAPAEGTPAGGRVIIKAISDDCWIQIRESDGQLVLSRLLRQGEAYTVPERSGLTLTAGNAGSLEITVDGKVAPSLGASKQVKRDIPLAPAKLLKSAR